VPAFFEGQKNIWFRIQACCLTGSQGSIGCPYGSGLGGCTGTKQSFGFRAVQLPKEGVGFYIFLPERGRFADKNCLIYILVK